MRSRPPDTGTHPVACHRRSLACRICPRTCCWTSRASGQVSQCPHVRTPESRSLRSSLDPPARLVWGVRWPLEPPWRWRPVGLDRLLRWSPHGRRSCGVLHRPRPGRCSLRLLSQVGWSPSSGHPDRSARSVALAWTEAAARWQRFHASVL
ncbi:hypothetical protein D3C71_1353060 [compost metagenome]